MTLVGTRRIKGEFAGQFKVFNGRERIEMPKHPRPNEAPHPLFGHWPLAIGYWLLAIGYWG
jgi:hypothetical protein